MKFSELVKAIRLNGPQSVVGYVSGVFDVLHPGHLSYLDRCESFCDLLVVGVDSDARVREAKGADRPFDSQEVRSKNLKDIGYYTFIKTTSAQHYVGVLRPQVLFCPFSQWRKTERMIAWDLPAPIILIPDTPGVSSSEIIDKKRREARLLDPKITN